MNELDRNDYERIIAQARRARSEALGNIIAGAVRAVMSLFGPRAPHHHLPTA